MTKLNTTVISKDDLENLFYVYFNPLVIYINGFVLSYSVSKDIAQEVFIKVWENRSNIKSPKSFIFKCAKNASLDYIKSKEVRCKVRLDNIINDINDIDDEIDELMEYHNRLDKLGSIIDQLPPQCQEVLKRIYFGNKKFSEVALEMNISLNTVKTHVYLSKKRLKERFMTYCFLIIQTI